jgi:simple sugar transport system permease protein
MLLAGVVGGIAWIAIPALLNLLLHTNEILTTLMFNYIAGLLVYYLIFSSHSYWRELSTPDSKIFPQSKVIGESTFWPQWSAGGIGISMGLMIGCTAAVLLLVVLKATRVGFSVLVVSESPRAAQYAGIQTRYLMLLVFALSGGLAGVAGASQVGDFSHRLEPQGLQLATLGYVGIAVACLARLNPVGVIPSAVFFGGLTNAGFQLQGASFPVGLVGMITGLILLSVLCSEAWLRYRVRIVRRGGRQSEGGLPVVAPTPKEKGAT